MVRVPSVESLVDSAESGQLSPFDSELLRLEAPTEFADGLHKLEATTAMLGHTGMTDVETEVVQSSMTIAELDEAIPAIEERLIRLQLLQHAYRQARSKLLRMEKEQ